MSRVIDLSDIHLGGIQFRVLRADGGVVDFSNMVSGFTWSDSVNVAGAEVGLEVEGPSELINQIGMEGTTFKVTSPLPEVTTGRVTRREMFRGFFEDVNDDRSSSGVARSITAYDIGKMLATDEEDYVFRGQTLSAIVIRVCTDFSIPIGSVPDTGRSLGDIVNRGGSLWDLFQRAVQKHHNISGETYRILFRDGRLYLERQASNTHWWVFEVGRSAQTFSRRRSIADLENRVKIYGNVTDDLAKAKVEATVENTQSQGIYGLRQRVEYASDADDRKKVREVAEQRIKLRAIPEEKIEVRGFAVPLLRAGERVRLIDPELRVTGLFYVETAECSWYSDSSESVLICRKDPVTPEIFLDDLVVA